MPYLWQNGTATELPIGTGYGATARGINDRGQIVGTGSYTNQDQTPTTRAQIWTISGS